MLNRVIEGRKNTQQEAGLSSTSASSSNIPRYQKQQQQQGSTQMHGNSNSNTIGNNQQIINSSASKGNNQFTNGAIPQGKGFQQGMQQAEQNSKNYMHNNRKLIVNSGSGGGGGSQFNSYSTQTTMNTAGGGYMQSQNGAEMNGNLNSMHHINNNNNNTNNLNNNIPLQYQSNKNSQILRMGDLMEYLLGKGYMRDACDSFLDYIFQVQDLPFNQLLCDEFCEGSEELQLKESALLYKLSTKFSSYLMQPASQNLPLNGGSVVGGGGVDGGINQARIDLDNSFVILQFIQKVILSAQNKHEESLVIKWKANYYSNLGIYYIRKHEYMLALNYFNLSLQMFQILQATFQQKVQEYQSSQQNQMMTSQTGGVYNQSGSTINKQNGINQQGSLPENIDLDEDIQIEEQINSSPQQNSARMSQSNQLTEVFHQLPQNLIIEMSGWTIQQSIVLNNLAVLHGIMDDLDRAEELLIQSVANSENEIFQAMKNVSTQYLRKDKQFLEKLPVLIYGYIFFEGVRKKKQIRHEPSILHVSDNLQQQQRSFLKNAYSLSRKYFGEDNPFTLKIDIFRRRFTLHNQHSDILAETFPFDIDQQKLKNTQLFLQQQKSEQIYVNMLLGHDSAGINLMSQTQLFSFGMNPQSTKQAFNQNSRKNSDYGVIEDIFDEKADQIGSQLNQQQQDQRNVQRKGRNKSMHQLSISNNPKTFGIQRPFPLSPGLNAYQIQQQQQQWVNRNQPVRSQHQFRIQTSRGENNIYKKSATPSQTNISKLNNQDEGQKQMQEEIRNLQQSLAQVENQLKTIKGTNNAGNQNTNESSELRSYKKDNATKQRPVINGINTDASSQIINSQLDNVNTNNNTNNNNNANNNNTDINQTNPQMQYSITNNNAYAVSGGTRNKQGRSHSNQSSNNSVRDERSNSNGSIKPSQFKKESNKEKQQQQNLNSQKEEQEQNNINMMSSLKHKMEQGQDTSRFPGQSKYSGNNPYMNQVYADDQKSAAATMNSALSSNRYQTPIQSGANTSIENQSLQYGGGSFSQGKQIVQNQNFKSTLRDIEEQTYAYAKSSSKELEKKKLSSNDKQEMNFKQELKQQQQQQQTKDTQKRQISQIANNSKDQHKVKKSGSDEKLEAPKLASMLQSQQNYQISKITETIVKNLQVDQVFVLKKRIHMKDSNESYVVKCGVLYNKQEKGYKIAISSQVGQNTAPTPNVEEIELSILTNLLCFVSFQDVLPSTMNLDSINTLYDVCKYFILPFVGLQNKQPERQSSSGNNNASTQTAQNTAANEPQNKVIMVNPRAHGILSEYHKTVFLDQNVLIQFNYIEGFQFRIVIFDKETNKKNLRIDVEYDEGSFNGLYVTTEQDEYHAQKLKDFFEGTEESEISKQGMELVHRDIEINGLKNVQQKKQTTKTEEYFIQSVKIQSFSQFNTHFTHIIKEFERIIKTFSTHSNLESVSRDLSSFRVRVYQGLKKSMTIITTDSQNKLYPPITASAAQVNNANNLGVRVLIFNNFDSYGAQGVKVKEKGEQILSVREIKKMYGLNYGTLLNEQKQILFTLCSYHFNLRVIEKIADSMQKTQSKTEENNIIRLQTVTGGESTFLIQGLDNYNYPITFEIFGSKDIFLGVKITLYNPILCEEQGIFLTTNHNSWLFQNEVLKKKLHHFCVDSLPLSNYFITHIFKKIAVPVLFSNLYIENINPNFQKQASLSTISSAASTPFGAKSNTDPKYCKNPPKLLGTKGLITDNCIILRLETLLDPNTTINYFLPSKQR